MNLSLAEWLGIIGIAIGCVGLSLKNSAHTKWLLTFNGFFWAAQSYVLGFTDAAIVMALASTRIALSSFTDSLSRPTKMKAFLVICILMAGFFVTTYSGQWFSVLALACSLIANYAYFVAGNLSMRKLLVLASLTQIAYSLPAGAWQLALANLISISFNLYGQHRLKKRLERLKKAKI